MERLTGTGATTSARRTRRSKRACSLPSPGTSPVASSASRALIVSAKPAPDAGFVAVALNGADRLLYHNEPIWRNGELVGKISSGMFGHTIGAALGLGYLANSGAPVSAEWIAAGQYEVEVAAERVSRASFVAALSMTLRASGSSV